MSDDKPVLRPYLTFVANFQKSNRLSYAKPIIIFGPKVIFAESVENAEKLALMDVSREEFGEDVRAFAREW